MPILATHEQLNLLMEYTLFHLGVYLTIASGMIVLIRLEYARKGALLVVLLFFGIAGACGGIIASHIPEYGTMQHFESVRLGPWNREWLKYECWAAIEHGAFWAGVVAGALAVVFTRARPKTGSGGN